MVNAAEAATSTMAAGAAIGALDLAVIGGVAAVAIYWFVLRKKKEHTIPEMKKLTVVAPLSRSDSYDPSFINKMKKTGKNIVVFYGSQTGTAEEFSSRLAKDAARLGMKGLVADPEECEMEDLTRLTEIDNSLAIFCVATYGEGDPTDNAQEFFDWLQDGSADLTGVNYVVFGLGNKTYEHYNKIGKYLDQRLEELGATRVHTLGLGDDDGNIEEDFITWKDNLWPAVCEHFGIEATGDDVLMREFNLVTHDETQPKEKIFTGEPARLRSFITQKPPFDAKNPFLAPLAVNKELHNGGDRSCMHIEFDITGSKIRYEAGDHVAVYPTNDSALVEGIGNRLSCDLDQIFSLINIDEDASKKHPFPCPTSYRTALTNYLDITHPIRTNILRELLEYATDDKDKAFLTKISTNSPEGKELYNDWILKDYRHILAVLEDLPSVKVPIDHLCEMLPKLQPRYYSISSSPKINPNIVSITAVLVDWKTRTGRQQKGVATSYLALKHPTEELKPRVPIFVRKSQFRLPFKPSVPIIMVGPGTGLAPFRGFIQDRHAAKRDGKPIGDSILYFGCRHEKEDWIYEDEMKGYLEDGTLSKIYTAFSRDTPEKVYVQHLIHQHSEEIYKTLDEGGHVYVCGDARLMAPDVDKALHECMMKFGNMDSAGATDYLKRLRSRGRYSCDVWS